jgi:hypothetical protein
MRYFRSLPPLLRVASLLGLPFPLAFLLPLLSFFLYNVMRSPPAAEVYADRLLIIGLNLGMVSMACSLVVRSYTERFRNPGTPGLFPLDSWQSQVGAFVLPAALPIGALVLAVIIPPTSRDFQIVFPVSILGAIVLGAAGAVILQIGVTRYHRGEGR